MQSFINSFMYSFIHALINSFIHALIHSFIHALIHSFMQSFMNSFTYSLIHSCTHSFTTLEIRRKCTSCIKSSSQTILEHCWLQIEMVFHSIATFMSFIDFLSLSLSLSYSIFPGGWSCYTIGGLFNRWSHLEAYPRSLLFLPWNENDVNIVVVVVIRNVVIKGNNNNNNSWNEFIWFNYK